MTSGFIGIAKILKIFKTYLSHRLTIMATDQRVNEHSGGKEIEKLIVLATENGGEAPILLREKQPVVMGVAVVCPGASTATCLSISSLLSALFGLEGSAISIQT